MPTKLLVLQSCLLSSQFLCAALEHGILIIQLQSHLHCNHVLDLRKSWNSFAACIICKGELDFVVFSYRANVFKVLMNAFVEAGQGDVLRHVDFAQVVARSRVATDNLHVLLLHSALRKFSIKNKVVGRPH